MEKILALAVGLLLATGSGASGARNGLEVPEGDGVRGKVWRGMPGIRQEGNRVWEGGCAGGLPGGSDAGGDPMPEVSDKDTGVDTGVECGVESGVETAADAGTAGLDGGKEGEEGSAGKGGGVVVDSVEVAWRPLLDVGMRLDLSGLRVSAKEAVEVIPLLVGEGDTLELPRVLVAGRTRQLVYERDRRMRREGRYAQVVRRRNGTEQYAEYRAEVRAERWMDGSRLVVVTDVCGCGWRSLAREAQEVAYVEAPRWEPQLAFVVPEREEVKVREKSGRAFLDFPLDKITIYPDYRNNPRELRRITELIDSVRTDKYATITAVDIKGFASPEGSYAHNARLAEGRARALSEYVRSLHDFGEAAFTVASEPEDWAGLDTLVSRSNLAEREALLAVIRDAGITDPDARDRRLRQLAGGAPYRFLLANFYPALRHSDYTVRYHIRNFTVEEAKELIYTDPKQLSLEEMYRVAETYAPGSPEFNEVFRIAVRMYPDDPVSNLNAANAALSDKDAAAARRYLRKALPGAEREQAERTLQELEEFLEKQMYMEYE